MEERDSDKSAHYGFAALGAGASGEQSFAGQPGQAPFCQAGLAPEARLKIWDFVNKD
jgi:hypothetical protein